MEDFKKRVTKNDKKQKRLVYSQKCVRAQLKILQQKQYKVLDTVVDNKKK